MALSLQISVIAVDEGIVHRVDDRHVEHLLDEHAAGALEGVRY